MLEEVEDKKKIYDEAELNDEIVKWKEKHLREPVMEDNPRPPNKKLKRWHNLKKKKRKKPWVFEKLWY